jgi:hypothetical protein
VTDREHLRQRDRVIGSLLADSPRETLHDVYPRRRSAPDLLGRLPVTGGRHERPDAVSLPKRIGAAR